MIFVSLVVWANWDCKYGCHQCGVMYLCEMKLGPLSIAFSSFSFFSGLTRADCRLPSLFSSSVDSPTPICEAGPFNACSTIWIGWLGRWDKCTGPKSADLYGCAQWATMLSLFFFTWAEADSMIVCPLASLSELHTVSFSRSSFYGYDCNWISHYFQIEQNMQWSRLYADD